MSETMSREERLAMLRTRNDKVRSPAVKWLLEEVGRMEYRVAELRLAIRRVLYDEESKPGAWGSDVTMVAVLRKALEVDEADRAAQAPTTGGEG